MNLLKILRKTLPYLLIIAAGTAVGYLAPMALKMMKSDHISGDYSVAYKQFDSEVLVFGTSRCPYCKKARELLDEAKVSYRFLDIDESAEARKVFEALPAQKVPVLLIGERRIDGFIEPAIQAALKLRARP